MVVAMPGIVQKRERGCNTFKWFTGPEICFALLSLHTRPKTAHMFRSDALNHTLAFAAAKFNENKWVAATAMFVSRGGGVKTE